MPRGVRNLQKDCADVSPEAGITSGVVALEALDMGAST